MFLSPFLFVPDCENPDISTHFDLKTALSERSKGKSWVIPSRKTKSHCVSKVDQHLEANSVVTIYQKSEHVESRD